VKQFNIPADKFTERCGWEPMGRSPGNTPMAKLQFAQVLMPFVADPNAGIDTYELVKVLLMNGPLENARGIQHDKEGMIAQQQQLAAAQAGMGGPGGPGAPQGPSIDAGGGPAAELPPVPYGPLPGPMFDGGPGGEPHDFGAGSGGGF